MIQDALVCMEGVLRNLDVFEWTAWMGLLYVVYRQFTTKNVVTFEANNPVREHRERLMTAVFYVPFVSLACFYVIPVMRIFVMIMIFQGMGEYMQIVFMKKTKNPIDYEFTTMDRIVQWLSLAPSLGFLSSYILAAASLYNVFFLIILIYLLILICTPKKKVCIMVLLFAMEKEILIVDGI